MRYMAESNTTPELWACNSHLKSPRFNDLSHSKSCRMLSSTNSVFNGFRSFFSSHLKLHLLKGSQSQRHRRVTRQTAKWNIDSVRPIMERLRSLLAIHNQGSIILQETFRVERNIRGSCGSGRSMIKLSWAVRWLCVKVFSSHFLDQCPRRFLGCFWGRILTPSLPAHRSFWHGLSSCDGFPSEQTLNVQNDPSVDHAKSGLFLLIGRISQVTQEPHHSTCPGHLRAQLLLDEVVINLVQAQHHWSISGPAFSSVTPS